MIEKPRLIDLVEKLDRVNVLVVGDVMLDRYMYGIISRISPEAPVPVLKSGQTKSTLGGAGNVALNLLALGSNVSFVSVVGNDAEAREINDILSNIEGVKPNLLVEPQRKTTVKTRFMADRQQVLRVDAETTHCLEKHSREMALKAIREFMPGCGIVVLSDYGKGFLSPDILRDIIEIGRESGKPVVVDPKGTDYALYRGASILTPNLQEISEATRLPVNGDDEIATAAKKLIDSCKIDAILVTRSQEGMSLIQSSGEVTHLKAEAKEVFDVSGAGDTVVAVVASAFGSGASLSEAAELANIAAGIVVGKVGTAVTHSKDLIQALHHQELSSTEAKILDVDTAMDRTELWRCKGYKVGFANGFFDLLHPGHLSLLTQAKETCDRLIVGLNGDISVRRIKGESPVQHETARSAILASLEVVDIVVIFQDDTPVRLLNILKPDVLIKGANYKPEEVVGADLVKNYGGEIVLADITDIYSTNSTIAQMTKGTL